MDNIHNSPTHVQVIDRLLDRHLPDLMRLYLNEFWCNTRTPADVKTMLANTDIIIGLENSEGQLLGFCRLLTDYVYKATLYDLIVDPTYRGQGMGNRLMTLVVEHPRLTTIQHIDLNCLPAMVDFYRRWGFTLELNGLGQMRRYRREV